MEQLMHKVLFLDDNFSRHNYFCNKEHDPSLRWEPHVCHGPVLSVFHVYTAAQVVSILKAEKNFDIVHLDHDLTINKPEQNNGLVVAQFIASEYKSSGLKIGNIVIHSWNAKRSEKMAVLLRSLHEVDPDLKVTVAPFDIA
jgi:hypothetical protein